MAMARARVCFPQVTRSRARAGLATSAAAAGVSERAIMTRLAIGA